MYICRVFITSVNYRKLKNTSLNISVVVPLYNEDESLTELFEWIDKVMLANDYTYEVIFVDDGSKDDSWKVIEALKEKSDCVKAIKFQRNYGKSAALHVAFQEAQGDVVITMDADLQDSPEEIPALYNKIVNDGYDLVSGWKQKRYDPLTKTIPTKLFNWATRKMSGIQLNDFNCGLKAYRLKVVKSIEVFGEMHRYVPVLAKRAGFDKIGEQVVQHQARKYGVTKFGIERFLNGYLDLFTVTFISKFGRKPMHFFGLFGTLIFMLSLSLFLWMGVDKLFFDKSAKLLASRSEFYIALIGMVIGTQFFLAGFIAELVGRKSESRNQYLIEKQLD